MYKNPLQFVLNLTPAKGRIAVLAIAAILAAVVLVTFSSSINILEERLGASGWTVNSDNSLEERIVIVTIDEQSLAEIGPWPWTRPQVTQLVSALNNAGVQLQIHDVVYSEAKAGDAELLAAFEASNGAVIAQLPILESENSVRAQVGNLTYAMGGVSCNNGSSTFPATQNYITATDIYSGIPKGHITPIVASDGAIRQFPALVCIEDSAYPVLGISALMQATNTENWSAEISSGTSFFGPAQSLSFPNYPGLEIPLDSTGHMRISYEKAPESFMAISAADVIAGNVDLSLLENAWVLVGTTAFGIGDIVPTPYSGATPGIEVQARILSSILDANMPYTPQGSMTIQLGISLLFALALFIVSSQPGRRPAIGLPIAAIALPTLSLLLHMQLLGVNQVWLGWTLPSLYGFFGASLLFLLEYARVRTERSLIFENLSSYLPSDLANEIALELPSAGVKAKRCDVTLLSADIRNFAAYGEARPPEETANILDQFFSVATEIIEAQGGRVYEFKGDSLLAVWDGMTEQSASSALRAAQSMQTKFEEELTEEIESSELEPLALGIGIEQGPVLIGSVGAAHRRSATMLGDTVTIALRVQEQTAELAAPILLGEVAARQLSDFNLQSQGSYLLSGLRIPHGIFAPEHKDSFPASAERPYLKVVS